MWLVVGLGNPGTTYATTRHNYGFMVLDQLAASHGAADWKDKFRGLWTRTQVQGDDVLLLKPQTYMNLSGESVQPAAAFFKVDIQHVLVLHDELDLPFGSLKLKIGGGHAGHNGLKSLIHRLGGPGFGRLRLGIGRPPPTFRGDIASYVLSSFDPSEQAELPTLLTRASQCCEQVVQVGLTTAMAALHQAEKPARRPKPHPPTLGVVSVKPPPALQVTVPKTSVEEGLDTDPRPTSLKD